jgi:hypothetical protein
MAVEQAQGERLAAQKFRLRWTENAEHISPQMTPKQPGRDASTWLVNYLEIIEQCLVDLCDWVERDIPPAATQFTFKDGKVSLPADAAERGGIQPVVHVRANGEVVARVSAGQSVNLSAIAEVPQGAGALTLIEWDFDGSGTYPDRQIPAGKSMRFESTTAHAYPMPGVYFATARATSHRTGDPEATTCRCENVASARVIVS